jgi:hypothetical protein
MPEVLITTIKTLLASPEYGIYQTAATSWRRDDEK